MQRTPRAQQQRSQLLNLKMGRGLEERESQKKPQTRKAHRKMLTTIFRETQIKTRMRGCLIPIRVASVLVCYGCHKKIPQLGHFYSRALFSHISWRLKSRGVGSFGFFQGLSACRWQPFHCVLTWPFPCVHSWFLSDDQSLSYEDTKSDGFEAHLNGLIFI